MEFHPDLMKQKVTVVIPIYKTIFSSLEDIALKQCFKVLKNYKITIIKPASLQLPKISDAEYFEVSFDDKYFSNVHGYNELMLSPLFYKEFLNFNYILIYQLDAFVFRDALGFWCEQGYDYIGAPWLFRRDYHNKAEEIYKNSIISLHQILNIKQRGTNLPTLKQQENQVGNGGFSLRKVEVFYNLALKYYDTICYYIKQNNPRFNEDNFWSIEINRKKKQLNIPDYKTAVYFSFEHGPDRAFTLTNSKLPFGCHAWDRALEFWRPYFKAEGYEI